jgi:hypothetical protein
VGTATTSFLFLNWSLSSTFVKLATRFSHHQNIKSKTQQTETIIYRPKSQNTMAYNEDSSASGHDEPWIQWYVVKLWMKYCLSRGIVAVDGRMTYLLFISERHLIISFC